MSKEQETLPGDWEVEDIVKSRTIRGVTKYLVKWKNYPHEENTWEPPEHLDNCPEILVNFLEKERAKKNSQNSDVASNRSRRSSISPTTSVERAGVRRRRVITESSTSSPAGETLNELEPVQNGHIETNGVEPVEVSQAVKYNGGYGFDKGYTAEKVLGATNAYGEVMFLVKWKGVVEADLVPATEANEKCPELVVDFYEERISFDSAETLNTQKSSTLQ